MMTKILFSCLALIFLVACTKDKYTTSPQLTFKKINRNVVNFDDILQITLEVTDKEGDLNDTLFIGRFYSNCRDSLLSKYKIPDFTPIKNVKGEITVCYKRRNDPTQACQLLTNNSCSGTDSAFFRFKIKDNAGNVSEPVFTPIIAIPK